MKKAAATARKREAKQVEPWVTYVILAIAAIGIVILFVLGTRPGGLFGSGAMQQKEAMEAYGKMKGPGAYFADPAWQKRLQEQHPERYGAPGTPFHMPNTSVTSSPSGATPASRQ